MSRIVVIGGGIAGVSAAFALAEHETHPEVMLIEAEPQLAHHTTGRSAALYIENYGTGPTRVLTKASRDYFHEPPEGLTDGSLLDPRGVLSVGRPDQDALFDRVLAEGVAINPEIGEITINEAVELFPVLRGERLSRAMFEPGASTIDVGALHQSFVRGLRQRGAAITPSTRAERLTADGAGWRIDTSEGPLFADVVVNAAGAWGDEVARRAGLAPVGLQPLRRTAFMVDRPAMLPEKAPLTAEVAHERWYLKPDGAQVLCSPADETPSEPCDAKPEEVDIARAIDDINDATTLEIRSVRSSWAGLRTFSPDRTMVIGADPEHPTFVWCVGQGGTGIQTAPAVGQLVAELALDGATSLGVDLADLTPDRFR